MPSRMNAKSMWQSRKMCLPQLEENQGRFALVTPNRPPLITLSISWLLDSRMRLIFGFPRNHMEIGPDSQQKRSDEAVMV